MTRSTRCAAVGQYAPHTTDKTRAACNWRPSISCLQVSHPGGENHEPGCRIASSRKITLHIGRQTFGMGSARARRERSRDVSRSLYRGPCGLDHVVRRWQQQAPCVHPTYNIEGIGMPGSVSDYTVHMYTMQDNTSVRIRKAKRYAAVLAPQPAARAATGLVHSFPALPSRGRRRFWLPVGRQRAPQDRRAWGGLGYLRPRASAWKNARGVAIWRPVRVAMLGVKCAVLCVSNQLGRLCMAESKMGTSAVWQIRERACATSWASGSGTTSGRARVRRVASSSKTCSASGGGSAVAWE